MKDRAPVSAEAAVPDAVPPPLRGISPENPWVGLRSFTEETAAYFFGRSAEVQDLLECIAHKPLTVFFGRSGLGKTSLIQAALVPLLRQRGYVPILLRLKHEPEAPSLERQVLNALRAALTEANYPELAAFPDDIESLWRLLHDPVYGFGTLPGTASAQGDNPLAPTLVFLFDQFEEIFTLGNRPDRQAASLAFRDSLSCLVENRLPTALRQQIESDDALANRLDYSAQRAKVLLTLREDFLHLLERWRRIMPSLMNNRFELRPLSGPQALEAVVEPGRLRAADLPPIISEETGLAIVRFVAGAAPEVPVSEIETVPSLISLICAELNTLRFGANGRVEEGVILTEQFGRRREDILKQFYLKCFADKPPAVRALVEDRLLNSFGHRESTTIDHAYHCLENEGVPAEDARRFVADLIERRLLVAEERGGNQRIELTHDVIAAVATASRDERHEREAAEREAAEAAARARQKRLDRIVFWSTAGILLVVAVGLGGYFVKRGWSVNASRSNYEDAQRWLAQGDNRLAIACLGKALLDNPDNEQARNQLWQEIVKGNRDGVPRLALPHPRPIYQAAFSADGTRIVTACQDGRAYLWSTETGKLLGAPLEHPGWVTGAVFSPAGGLVATACTDDKVRLWDVATGKLVGQPLGHEGLVNRMVFSHDGGRLLTASDDHSARLWDVHNGALLTPPLRHGARVLDASFSPDGTRVVTASLDGTARMWATTGEPLGFLVRHDAAVNGVAFSPDGTRVVTASSDGTARLCDAATGRPLAYPMRHEAAVTSAVFSPDGTRIVTASDDGTARLWDATTGKSLGRPWPHGGAVTSAVFSPNGTCVLTADKAGIARLWSVDTGEMIGLEMHHDDSVNSAVFNPDGRRILTASRDGFAAWWDAVSGQPLAKDDLDAANTRWQRAPRSLPGWFDRFIDVLSGYDVRSKGPWKLAMGERVASRDQLRSEMAQPAYREDPYWNGLAYWILSPPEQRNLFPSSNTLVSSFVAGRAEDEPAKVRQAWQIEPYNPMILLALAGFEPNAVRAAFLRSYAAGRLPADVESRSKGAALLRRQGQPLLGLGLVAATEPDDPLPQRQLAACLKALGRKSDALAIYQNLTELAGANALDYANYLYGLALENRGADATAIFQRASKLFPENEMIQRYHGWSLVNLGLPDEALAAFLRCEQLVAGNDARKNGTSVDASSDLYAGLVVAQWVAGESPFNASDTHLAHRQEAVRNYRRLIQLDPSFAHVECITASTDWTDAEKKPLVAALLETLRRYPELAPAP